MNFIISNDINEIKNLVSDGFIPVECSIGGESIIDKLELDHHNNYSHKEGVAIRGYRDLYNKCSDAPGFVIAGNADADATFCVASLMGLIPHPNYIIPSDMPPHIAKLWKKDWIELAVHINNVDINPIETNLFTDIGQYLMLWHACSGSGRDNLGFAGGVALWRAILSTPINKIGAFLKAPVEAENERIKISMNDLEERSFHIDDGVHKVMGINRSRVFGFPEWYKISPIVLALTEYGNITIGIKNKKLAEEIFGIGGLKNVLPHLTPKGWGGRETVGGSPRGLKMDESTLKDNMKIVISLMK